MQHGSQKIIADKNYYEHDAQKNPLWGTQREIALTENILRAVHPKAKTLIDIGCGDGFFLHQATQKKSQLKLHGVDLSEERLKRSRQNVPKAEFTLSGIEKLPFQDKTFDVVVCSEVLEHVIDPVAALKELWRIAKSQVIVTVPNDQPIVPLDCPNCQQRHYLSGHIHQIDEKKILGWSKALTGAHAECRKFHTIFTYNKITLKLPRILRLMADLTIRKTEPVLHFTKPSFLMMTLTRNH